MNEDRTHRVGWIGTGRMGTELVTRLLRAGCDVTVFNRTRAKAEPLAGHGATIVERAAALADRDLVFTVVGDSADFEHVTFGRGGLLAAGHGPHVVVDISTVSATVSQRVRDRAAEANVQLLAAPISGNPSVVRAGKATVAASGPREAFDLALPYLELFGSGVTYVGDGEAARLVKICHNLMLGIVSQALAEISVLAERGGVSRSAFLAFLNDSVMGSTFTRYKTPALVNLDYTPTFTSELLLKDFDLGAEAASDLRVPMPVASLVREVIQALVGQGHGEDDFAALLELAAAGAGLELVSEDLAISDGLDSDLPVDSAA